MKQRARTIDHTVWLQRHLKDPKEAIAYLREFLKDDGEGDHWPLLLKAVHNVAAAHPIGSDLRRLDGTRDEDIDYSDSPTPDLADWVRYAFDFTGVPDAAKGH